MYIGFPSYNIIYFDCFSDIWKQSRSAMKNVKLDIHAKLMRSYKQVPQWWFLILLIGSIVLSLVMSFVWKDEVQLPWWGMLFAFGLAWVVTLPIGVIQATTNQVIFLYFFFQLLFLHSYFSMHLVVSYPFFVWNSATWI